MAATHTKKDQVYLCVILTPVCKHVGTHDTNAGLLGEEGRPIRVQSVMDADLSLKRCDQICRQPSP